MIDALLAQSDGFSNNSQPAAYQTLTIQADESRAVNQWAEMLRRGLSACAEQRHAAAGIYFDSALDIGLARHQCEYNSTFGARHITMPATYLLSQLLETKKFHLAHKALAKIAKQQVGFERNHFENLSASIIAQFLAERYEAVEQAEKQFMLNDCKQANSIYCD